MTKYDLHFICKECGNTHMFPITLSLDDGPADKATIDETYRGKRLPPEVARTIAGGIKCADTGRWTRQVDDTQIFLVPADN